NWLHITYHILQAMRIAITPVIVTISVGTNEELGMLNANPEVDTGGLNIAGGKNVEVGNAMVIKMMSSGYQMQFFNLGY
ncbi:PTS sugar transporter subunit IIC, partial [Salmonella enterica]|uniref:PTS sugar transporter subunit IIC n=1 Tax=Salmonella enterica TaxID=28901 RepID=UPI00079B274C